MSLFDGYVVNQEIETVVKIYPHFARLYKYKNPFLSRRYDYDQYNPYPPNENKAIVDPEESERQSLRRAKTTLTDIALCNDFDLFVTFTFAKDRENVDAKRKQMAFWLNNQRILHGKFKYIIVPEYHKDKKALHFHGLFSGYKGNLKDSGCTKNGRIIHNIGSYRGGFTTAVKIDDIKKVSSYVAKYMTKEMPKFRNKQRYWCTNDLKRPAKIINPLLTSELKELFKSVFQDSHKEIFETDIAVTQDDVDHMSNYGQRRYDDLRVADWF